MLRIIVIVLLVFIVVSSANSPRTDIKDEVREMGGSVTSVQNENGLQGTVTGNDEIESVLEENLHWYTNLDDALNDKSVLGWDYVYTDSKYLMNNLLFQSTSGNITDFVFKVPLGNDNPKICKISVKYQNGKYSSPYNAVIIVFNDLEGYDVLDHTADEILSNYVDYNVMKRSENLVWYGAWSGKSDIERLRIAGNPVNKIIPVEYEDGVTRYFWYYDKTDLSEPLKKINLEQHTLRQLEEALQLTLVDE